MSNAFFANNRKPKAVTAEQVAKRQMTEDQLGESIRDACKQLGWEFLWLRKTINSSDGILDLMLIRQVKYSHLPEARDHILHRELKGHDARGRLGKTTPKQDQTIVLINAVGGNAAVWVPEDWYDGQIIKELTR